MSKTSKFYRVTNIELLKAFNEKTVTMEPVINNALVLRLLRDFTNVPGVERIEQVAETAPEVIAKTDEILAIDDIIPDFMKKSAPI